jgi:hypothetical protein
MGQLDNPERGDIVGGSENFGASGRGPVPEGGGRFSLDGSDPRPEVLKKVRRALDKPKRYAIVSAMLKVGLRFD